MSDSEIDRLRERLKALETENRELKAALEADQFAHREALEALLATQQRLRRAQEAGGVGVFTIDVQANTLLATPELCRIFGLPVKEAMSADIIEELVIPQDRHLISHARQRREAKVELETEYRIRRADDGRERCIARRAEIERDASGRPVKLLGVLQDVTEQRAAQRALEHTAAELRRLNQGLERDVAERTADRNRLWELSSDIMMVADENAVFTAVNPAWTSVLGWEQHELLGRSAFEFVHPDDLPASREAAERLRQGEPIARFDHRFRHRDGSYRWINWAAVPGDRHIHAVGRDFTAQKEQAEALQQAEEALRQSQKMEAVGQLTGGLAHDFNNLLAGITASLELLQLRLRQGRTADLDRYVEAAQSSARRAAALTHRLLAFSRRQTLDPKPTDVNRLVRGMEELVRRTVGPNIDLEVVMAAGLWTALADAHQLESALLNLCINARDAMPEGGRLTIETANRELDERLARERELAPGQYLSLCVSDTGTGMTHQVMLRAFEPFFTTKPPGMGTGLGLSMVYGFARQSGGQVRIYSELEQGTSICIYLPRHHENAGEGLEEPLPEHRACASQGARVLVVDDEPHVRTVIVEVVRELGCEVLEAGDGAAALAILQSPSQLDLLITDVGLPGAMNGHQVADAARSLRVGLKVLLVSGYAENAAIGRAGGLAAGMQILSKPFSIDMLARRIVDLMDNEPP